MSLCKIGDRWSSVDVILVVEFFSSKIIWFQLEWDKADTVNVSFEERKHIREVLLKDKRFVALGENVILQFEKIYTVYDTEIFFKNIDYGFLFSSPIDDHEIQKFCSHIEKRKKKAAKEKKSMKLLFEHLVEIEKKLDAITYGPSSNIAAEAAKSFTGHQEERQILKEKESVKDAEK